MEGYTSEERKAPSRQTGGPSILNARLRVKKRSWLWEEAVEQWAQYKPFANRISKAPSL